MASDEDFNNIMLRLNQDVVEETFNEAGTFYWRFIGSNADGSCESQSQVYKVTIGESELKCPNVFPEHRRASTTFGAFRTRASPSSIA